MKAGRIFKEFSEQIADIYLYQRVVSEVAKREVRFIDEQYKRLTDKSEFYNSPTSFHNMTFKTACGGEHQRFGRRESTLEEQARAVVHHKNKQYQWLLVEAYELFEDFLTQLYACAALRDFDFWPLQDFGDATFSELEGKTYAWFLEQAKKKRNTPESILNRFRAQLPDLERIERNNKLDTNLKLAVIIAAELRHNIVHNGGRVLSRSEFVEKVLKKAGVHNNGKFDPEHEDLASCFIGPEESGNLILLLEIPTNPDIPFDTHINVFEMLANYLMAYAHLLCEQLGADISHSPSYSSEVEGPSQ